MALTIKQLNTDASFLLAFEPIDNDVLSPTGVEAFHALLDPCILPPGASQGLQANFWSSSLTHPQEQNIPPQYIESLNDLPEPDIVIISSAKNDRCHEATLRQLPRQSSKMRILAEPAAAKRIRSWRHFDSDMIEVIPRWEELPRLQTPGTRQQRKEPVIRIPIQPQVFGGDPGEITVTYITQKRDLAGGGGRSAVGITYKPPTTSPSMYRRRTTYMVDSTPIPPCPPQLPTPELTFLDSPTSSSPSSPASTLDASFTSPHRRTADRTVKSCATWRSVKNIPQHTRDRGVSVIFSPNGIPYSAIEGYATTHLLRQAVLPLTALLHCFDSFSQPRWFRGGSVHDGSSSAGSSSGGVVPMGQETAAALGAKAWIGDRERGAAEKDTRRSSLVEKLVRKKTHQADEVRETLVKQLEREAASAKRSNSNAFMARKGSSSRPTEVLAMEVGEEIVMTSEGVWDDELWIEEEPEMPPPLPPMSKKREAGLRIVTPDETANWLSINW